MKSIFMQMCAMMQWFHNLYAGGIFLTCFQSISGLYQVHPVLLLLQGIAHRFIQFNILYSSVMFYICWKEMRPALDRIAWRFLSTICVILYFVFFSLFHCLKWGYSGCPYECFFLCLRGKKYYGFYLECSQAFFPFAIVTQELTPHYPFSNFGDMSFGLIILQSFIY